MKSKLAFIGKFLLIFAVLTFLGGSTETPKGYAAVLARTAAILSPVANGWSLESRRVGDQEKLWFRRGAEEMRLLLGLEHLALGLLPLLSLIGATPGMTWRQRLKAAALGILGLFSLDLLVLLLYPWLVRNPNPLTDIAGTFLGLLTFVGGPVILWFSLTYRQMRSVWKF
jgi:hypothetical protein